jgi:uncharacterized membrane protein
MKQFIKGVFTDVDGSPSSKRVIMFALTIFFIAIALVNLFTGKSLSDTLQNQLFYLICWIYSAVFGEKITAIFKKDKLNV